MWLITVEIHESKVRRRCTDIWKQTILTREAPDDYIETHNKKIYFQGRDDEALTEIVLIFAIEVAETPSRLGLLGSESEVDLGSVKTRMEWQ